MSSKKITYSSEYKLKVLDYYFKHGGDEKFGLKKKTASHFNIDKKTINRMLNNPDMVKRARKLLAARKASGSAKAASSGPRQPVKPVVKKAGGTTNKSSTTATKSASSSQPSASSSSSSNKASTSTSSSTKTVGSNSRQQVNSTTNNSNKSTPTKSKPGGLEDKGSPGVEVYELPEDPDYSLLKQSINAASNGVASLAKLLVTGTDEVRSVVLNECDVILECKVCRNLFRSIVNFLAHKRIYCQEEFADVRTLFHKGDVQGVTSQSNTIVVEPEPPPEDENFNPLRTAIPTTHISPLKPIAQGRSRRSGIDSIALKLARKRKAYHASSSTHVGSSSYYQSVSEVSRSRDKLSRDCSVVLEDIGVANAVFQTYVPPGAASPSTSMSCMVDEAANSKSGITVAINQNGDIVKTAAGNITSMDVDQPSSSSESRDLTCLLCNTSFATQKTLSVHQRSHHGYERCIYYCPICQASFLSMWAVVKHLQRTHKKTKNQIERLRKVVRKNVRKKMTYQNTDKDKTDAEPSKEVEESVEEDVEEEEESNDSSTKASELVSTKKNEVVKSEVSIPVQASPVKTSTHKGEDSSLRRSPDHRCVKCDRKFSTPCALVSHDKFCSLRQMMPPESSLTSRLRSETPEKKIAIQIRKDYKKPVTAFDVGASNPNENKITQVMFKIPKTPQEKENQSKIEVMMSEFCNLPSLACIPCGRRYQAIAALKRHASLHIDWTRFECKVCQFRSYHRYETINHCIAEHKVKESAAGNILVENEYVGGLRYFLDNEDSTPATSDTEQDHHEEEETCSHTISLVSNRGSEASTSHCDLETTPSEMEVDGTGHLEANKSASDDTSDPVVLPEKHGTKEDYPNTLENVRSKEYESPEKAKDLLLLDTDANKVCLTGTTVKQEESVTALDKTSDSESLVKEVQKPTHVSKGVFVDMSLQEDNCSNISCEDKMEKCLCEKEDNISSCKEEINRSCKDIPESKDHVIDKGIIYFKSSEVSKEENAVKKDSNSTVSVVEFNICSLTNKDATSNTDTSEHADKPDNCHAMEDCVIDQHSEKIHENVKDEVAEKVIQRVEEEDTEKVNDEEAEKAKDKVEGGTEEIKVKAEDRTKEIDKVEDGIEEITYKVEPDTEEMKDEVEDTDTEKIADIDDEKTENTKHNFEDKDTEKIKGNDEETENSKDDADEKTENTKDNDQETESTEHNDEEDTENTEHNDDEDTENTQDKFEFEDIDQIKDTYDKDIEEVDVFKDCSSNDDDTEDTAISKTDDTESSSSCIEIREQDSMTECSEQTTTSQSAMANDTAEDEMSISESEADEFCGEIEEIKSLSSKGKEKLMVKDESLTGNLIHKLKDIDLYDYKNPSIAVHRCEEMKRDANFGMLQAERDVKPIIPKDDLSLEVKDFVGFPSEKDDKFDRPHRMRRSIEQLDFIYDSTKTVSQKTQSENDGSSVSQIELQGSKQEGGRCSLRRRSSLGKSEVVAKKVKSEEEYKPESCNGSSFQSTANTKNENHTLSPKKSIEGQLSKTSEHQGSSSLVERRKVRLVRRRIDIITPGGSFSLSKDADKSKVNESGKGKNLEKTVSESNCTNSKTLITKESPTSTRYSSRLKLASGPISKKENKQHDILSARILTNGQGQSNSVVTAEKVKL